jgi:hypothetical protein
MTTENQRLRSSGTPMGLVKFWAQPISDLGFDMNTTTRLRNAIGHTIGDLVAALPTAHHNPNIGRRTIQKALLAIGERFVEMGIQRRLR